MIRVLALGLGMFFASCASEPGQMAESSVASRQPAEPDIDHEIVLKNGQYVVMVGDNLAKIAQLTGLKMSELSSLNPEVDWTKLRVGQLLRITHNS